MPTELTLPRYPWAPPGDRTAVPRNHGGQLVDVDTVIVDQSTSEPVIAQVHVGDRGDLAWLPRYLRLRLQWDDADMAPNRRIVSSARVSGIRSPQRVFGFTAPAPLRKRYGASSSRLAATDPELWAHLTELTGELWLPGAFSAPAGQVLDPLVRHARIVADKVHGDWWFGDAPFTSGIVNRSASLPYHRDSGNLVGTWSMMLVLRKHMAGGLLHIPEYRVALAVPDASLVLFNGQQLWHGVTPMRAERPDAYRFSLVWYAKAGLAKCGPAEAEAKRAAGRATELLDQRYRSNGK